MRIFIVLLLSFMCTGVYSITNRKAILSDIPSLLKLYDDMTEVDKKKLVLAPKEYRRKLLAESVSKGQMFGAFQDGKALAMVQMYLLSNEELVSKLTQFKWTQLTQPVRAEEYHVCGVKLKQSSDTFHSSILGDKFIPSPVEARIYIGSAYTLRAMRGRRIMSRLNAAALKDLKKPIISKIKSLAEKYEGRQFRTRFAVLYGQVAAWPQDERRSLENIKRHFILRAVSKFLMNASLVHTEGHKLCQFAYKHSLPALSKVDNKLVQVDSDIPAYGCILTSEVQIEHD